MARREDYSTSVDAAFNLFMDTIANAFGGILLIAIAVCVLLQLTGDASEEKDAKAKEALNVQLARLHRENQNIEELCKSLNIELSDESLADSTVADKARALTLRKQHAEEKAARDAAKAAEVEKELAELKLKTSGQSKASAFATEYLGLKREFDELVKERYRKTSSTAVATTKEQVPILISGGRMIFLLSYDEKTGRSNGLNRREVEEITNEKGRRYFRPRKGKGIVVEDTPEFRAKLAEIFSQYSPQKKYLGFCVWPDSFKEFAILRQKTVDSKLGFYLVLMQKDAAVSAAGPAEEMGSGGAAAQ